MVSPGTESGSDLEKEEAVTEVLKELTVPKNGMSSKMDELMLSGDMQGKYF